MSTNHYWGGFEDLTCPETWFKGRPYYHESERNFVDLYDLVGGISIKEDDQFRQLTDDERLSSIHTFTHFNDKLASAQNGDPIIAIKDTSVLFAGTICVSGGSNKAYTFGMRNRPERGGLHNVEAVPMVYLQHEVTRDGGEFKISSDTQSRKIHKLGRVITLMTDNGSYKELRDDTLLGLELRVGQGELQETVNESCVPDIYRAAKLALDASSSPHAIAAATNVIAFPRPSLLS